MKPPNHFTENQQSSFKNVFASWSYFWDGKNENICLYTFLVLFSLVTRPSYCHQLCLLEAVAELADRALLTCLLGDMKKVHISSMAGFFPVPLFSQLWLYCILKFSPSDSAMWWFQKLNTEWHYMRVFLNFIYVWFTYLDIQDTKQHNLCQ